MSQGVKKAKFTPGSLHRHEDPRTVLLRMALDEERAERIRSLKNARPDLTWGDIAAEVGVTERSAIDWQKTGGISHPNSEKLAEVFGVDPHWLWSGVEQGTPDLFRTLRADADQFDRIEAKLDAILELLIGDAGAAGDAASIITRGFVAPNELAEGEQAQAGSAPLSDAKPAARPARSPRTRRSA